MCGVKKETGGPNRPHDAHDAVSWGAAGRLQCAINPNKTLKIHAVGRPDPIKRACCMVFRCVLLIFPALLWL